MKKRLSGWARTAPSVAEVVAPTSADGLAATVDHPPPRGLIARGLGRSYGDAAQNGGGLVADATGVTGIRPLDMEAGIVTVAAGTSLEDIMRWALPRGWFVPVSPGTRYVTAGGAVAADIHGKNHHRDGTWCAHVRSVTLRTPAGETLTVGPDRSADVFWATAGGMGLTGLILDVTVALRPVETSRLLVDTDRTADLDEVMALMVEGDDAYGYSVAWIDLIARGRSMGRSVLTRGDFAPADALSGRARGDPLAFDPKVLLAAPPIVPPGLLNNLSIRAFNEFWYRKAPRRRRGELQGVSTFFHPLDGVKGWNRLYGPRGFLQWQMAVPDGAEDTVRSTVEALSGMGCPSFLAVLKRFGPANPGPLSFPMAGWTLAHDVPVGNPALGPMLDRLDREVVDAGGRLYLAKDSRLDPALLPAMYPRLEEWREVRAKLDPDGVLQSDLARRLDLL